MTPSESCTAANPQIASTNFFRELVVSAGNLYCRVFHNSISRPVAGRYRCWKCLRDFEMDW